MDHKKCDGCGYEPEVDFNVDGKLRVVCSCTERVLDVEVWSRRA